MTQKIEGYEKNGKPLCQGDLVLILAAVGVKEEFWNTTAVIMGRTFKAVCAELKYEVPGLLEHDDGLICSGAACIKVDKDLDKEDGIETADKKKIKKLETA